MTCLQSIAMRAPMPRTPKPAGLVTRLCKECLRAFAQKRCDQVFCGSACRRVWHARVEARRTEAYDAGMAMRLKHKGGLTRLTNLFDAWIREDRASADRYRAACAEKGVEE